MHNFTTKYGKITDICKLFGVKCFSAAILLKQADWGREISHICFWNNIYMLFEYPIYVIWISNISFSEQEKILFWEVFKC